MADFQTSTHRGKWIFTEHELLTKREETKKRAKKMIEKYGTTRLEVDIDGSLSYPEPLNEQNNDAEHHSLPKPLKCEEEQLMRVFYERKIQEVCGAFYFPSKIQATAIIYFKRFYLQWSVMEHQPKHVMLTCIYAACKVEESHISAEELGKGINQDPQIILNNEMIVLQSLGFDLIVYAPYRSIDGFIEDMKEVFQPSHDDQIRYKDLGESAKSVVDRIMLTDAPLLFSPGQLALVALHMSNNGLRVVDLRGYVESIFGDSISELDHTIAAVDIMLEKLIVPTLKDVKPIDRKLKHCWDPSSHDNGKKEKKSKRKSKRTASEMDGNAD